MKMKLALHEVGLYRKKAGGRPYIKPMEKEFFFYLREGQGITITEHSLDSLMDEYAKENMVDHGKIDEIVLNILMDDLMQETAGTKWNERLSGIERTELYALTRNVCQKRTYWEAMGILEGKLDQAYPHQLGRKIFGKIQAYFDQVVAVEVIKKAKKAEKTAFSIDYNGVDNPEEIQVKWDFSKNYHKQLCENLGVTEEEYETIQEYFLPENKWIEKAGSTRCEAGTSLIPISIPKEVLFFLKNLYIKRMINMKEKRAERNKILTASQKFASLKISQTDRKGRKRKFHYLVHFQMNPDTWQEYGYQVSQFQFQFEYCK